MKKKLFYIFLFIISSAISAHATRSLYVDNFENILGDVTAENTLLSYAQSHNIEALLLYGLQIVNANHNLVNPNTNYILSDFIYKAKTNYGILAVGATAENGFFFTNVIDAYNNSRNDSLEKFDIYNLEFEYWNDAETGPGGYYCTTYLTPNGLPCTVNKAFQFYISILQTMDSLAINNSHPITTEAYVGWPTSGQADTISMNLDRLRLHAYVSNPNTAFDYSEARLIDFANGTPELDISIIFSSEPNFMQNWLEDNSMMSAENIFASNWLSSSSGSLDDINLEGFTYFKYTDLTDVPLQIFTSTFNERPKKTSIYPLITNDVLFIEVEENIDELNIYDINGRKVKEIKSGTPNNNAQVNIEELIPGIYLLTLRYNSNLESYMFIKQ